MTLDSTSGSNPIEDNDLVVVNAPAPEPKKEPAPAGAPRMQADSLGMHLDVRVDMETRPPEDPKDPSADVPERVKEYDAMFLDAVQRNLSRLGSLKSGGRAVGYRSLKHWNTSIGRPDDVTSAHRHKDEEVWSDIMKRYGALFDQQIADENDFIVLLEFPSGEKSPIHVRRISDSLQH